MDLMKYSTKITLFSSYFDLNQNLNTKSILAIFQDVASIHAEEIGVGFEQMFSQNLYWVLSRIKFDILKMPALNQTVVVETWPHPNGRVDFDRDIKISSESGETLIVGTTKWCVIDTISRRLQRANNVVFNGEFINEKLYEENLSKITLPTQELTPLFKHKVNFSDLDRNQHMNNTNYANLILNADADKKFNHFEINFLNECMLNDEIIVSATKIDDTEYITGTVNDKTVFVALTK